MNFNYKFINKLRKFLTDYQKNRAISISMTLPSSMIAHLIAVNGVLFTAQK